LFPPKNGHWRIALIVGCPADRYRDVRRTLAERAGIAAPYHIENTRAEHYTRMRPSQDLDVAFIMTDFIGHTVAISIRKALRRAGVPTLLAHSSWARMRTVLYRYHLVARGVLPLAVQTSLIERGEGFEPTIDETAEPPQQPEPRLIVLPAVVETPPTTHLLASSDAQLVAIFAQEIRLRLTGAGLNGVLITQTGINFDFLGDPS
jgi:hypothetical protein